VEVYFHTMKMGVTEEREAFGEIPVAVPSSRPQNPQGLPWERLCILKLGIRWRRYHDLPVSSHWINWAIPPPL